MHVVWRIPELRELILQNLEVGPKARQKPLVPLSQTCRDLREPALCRLWTWVCSFDKILRLLPTSKLEPVSPPPAGTWTVMRHIVGTISPADVSLIRYYGKFVRTFWFTHPLQNDPCILATDLRQIIDAMGGEPLFPNLSRLTYDGPMFDEFLPAVLVPSIEKIELALHPGNSEHWNQTMELLARGAPHTSDLHLRLLSCTREESADLQKILVNRAPMFTRLQLLSLEYLDSGTALSIALLPRVLDLSISVRYPPISTEFARLQPASLSLHSGSPIQILQAGVSNEYTGRRARTCFGADILALLRPRALRHVNVSEITGPAHMRHLCELLGRHCSDTLETLTLRGFGPRDHARVRLSDVAPLLECANLESVVLSSVHFRPAEADLPRLGRAWPLLRHLAIEDRTHDGLYPLRALATFATSLPSLRTLQVCLDATDARFLDSAVLDTSLAPFAHSVASQYAEHVRMRGDARVSHARGVLSSEDLSCAYTGRNAHTWWG
ncbi:uncharacterized protein SCHCODRAFT_02557448 [Schizophyllum commune H4-8]|uniref:uncharacterized protein n=1 Tax=Schizophyllum commune (strain H4-8 / FGSC 9210) TaxID=578458 RepID=UPI00215E4214|nr:uncharacterized protein SCHCODRAFT_02557448 [Schizophyllum commune H4-8]KAI5885254.1 hypothetical protein SCHCODRAFT_02557448 [Schizophyllum commune H4-8]